LPIAGRREKGRKMEEKERDLFQLLSMKILYTSGVGGLDGFRVRSEVMATDSYDSPE